MSILKRFLAHVGLDNNNQTLVNVADPVNAQDAATKNYALAKAGDTSLGTQIFRGSASVIAFKVSNIAELGNLIAAAPTATQTLFTSSGAVQFHTVAATANWTLNITFSAGTTMNTAMAVGDIITVALMATTNGTPFYPNVIQVDGSTVTPKWQDGVAPSAGNASSIDTYTFTIIKTASATFVVTAAQTQYR